MNFALSVNILNHLCYYRTKIYTDKYDLAVNLLFRGPDFEDILITTQTLSLTLTDPHDA